MSVHKTSLSGIGGVALTASLQLMSDQNCFRYAFLEYQN